MASDSAYFAGIDIGGTNVKMAAMTATGITLERLQFPTHDTELAEWSGEVRFRLEEWSATLGQPDGYGVSAPGIVSPDHRAVSWMMGRMEALRGFEWTDFLGSTSFVPVLNDAKAALVAEAWIGAARGAQNAFLLTLGTGVGGAAIVDGRLMAGTLGRAGHLGHICLDPYGSLDIVRTPGSLEEWIGDSTLSARSENRFSDTRTLVQAVRDGDAAANSVWHKSVRGLAAGIASLVNVLDPEIVILGGGIAAAGPILFDPLADMLDEIEWRPFGTGVPVVAASLGEWSGAIGAARYSMLQREKMGNAAG